MHSFRTDYEVNVRFVWFGFFPTLLTGIRNYVNIARVPELVRVYLVVQLTAKQLVVPRKPLERRLKC